MTITCHTLELVQKKSSRKQHILTLTRVYQLKYLGYLKLIGSGYNWCHWSPIRWDPCGALNLDVQDVYANGCTVNGTVQPPYSGASERSLSAIWDTSHWNFFVKFGLRTAWDISYDILLSLLKFFHFWRLQGRLSILAKIECLQKIKVFSMKERRGFDATWGF